MTNPVLEDLVGAIERGAWPEAADALERALEALPPLTAVQIAVEQVQTGLPMFEKYRSKIGWPRAALAHLATGQPLPEDFDFSPEVEGVNPIVRYFLDGIDLLDAAASDQGKPHVCAVECTKAILSSLHVRRHEEFARLFPRDWRLVLRREAGEDEVPLLQSSYLNEPVIVSYVADVWRIIAAAVIERLG